MANGITGLSPFPTMGGGNQGAPGITSVEITPTRVNFPTARTRTPAPESNELTGAEKYIPGVLGIVGLIDNAVNRNKYKVTAGFKKTRKNKKIKRRRFVSDE